MLHARFLVLLSDGQAEDLAYFHSDVVNLARKTGIVINAIGYPRSVSLSVALQTLRRLSEETGGTFKEVDQSLELENSYIRKALNNIFTGGQFIVSLEDLSNTSNKKAAIKLSFDKNDSLLIPIKLPLAKTTIEPINNNNQSETATNVKIRLRIFHRSPSSQSRSRRSQSTYGYGMVYLLHSSSSLYLF